MPLKMGFGQQIIASITVYPGHVHFLNNIFLLQNPSLTSIIILHIILGLQHYGFPASPTSKLSIFLNCPIHATCILLIQDYLSFPKYILLFCPCVLITLYILLRLQATILFLVNSYSNIKPKVHSLSVENLLSLSGSYYCLASVTQNYSLTNVICHCFLSLCLDHCFQILVRIYSELMILLQIHSFSPKSSSVLFSC